ncbi:hypothetical protein LAZ67_1004494 [Cordylochernes scorpioides]|uniref:Reverse transcriptase domain-containing protein n=1 Tax=Cordylochernes scorpioides TaxID=51811 RepID=A0ABY6JXJ8_9ARAC|nr:hypothetical protein LAZ67_1004494 [Cordylochernes scorpioides]
MKEERKTCNGLAGRDQESYQKDLSKGLKYRPQAKTDAITIIAGVESSIFRLNHQEKFRIRQHTAAVLSDHNQTQHTYQINKNVLRSLSTNKDITITRSDKGSLTVIMNTSEYISKMDTILVDPLTFTPISIDDQNTATCSFKKEINNLLRKKIISSEECKNFLSNIMSKAYIYGLPKLHKEGIPLRPIIAYHLSPAAPLATYLAKILAPMLRDSDSPTTISSIPVFIGKLQQTTVTPDTIMVSFDVVNLYPSLPHQLILDCTTEFLIEQGCPTDTISKLIALIKISLCHSIFKFNQAYFKQTKGTPMGSPLSSPLSEIVMRKIDKRIVNIFPDDILIWSRYIDDTETCDSLAFLDIRITKTRNRYNTEVYYKPTFHPMYINFSSFCPLSHKINTVRTLSKRIYTHCNTEESKQRETNNIISNLMSSGYPKNFILRHFHNPSRTKIYDNYKSICTIPYSLQSIKIARELKNFGIRTYFSNTPSIGTILRNPITKDNTPRNTLQRNNAVYSIKCNDCDSVYVGETGRYIKDRIQEHDRNIRHNDPKSLIVQHISQTGHSFNTTDPRSHYSNIPHKHKRLVVEALLSLRYNSINRHVEDMLTDLDLTPLNNGENTYLSKSTGTESAIDITAINYNIAPTTQWKILRGAISDH